MNHTYFILKCVFRRFDYNLFSVNKNLTFIGKVNAGHHIHKCGFARTVFADNAQIIARFDRKIQVLRHGLAVIAERQIFCGK